MSTNGEGGFDSAAMSFRITFRPQPSRPHLRRCHWARQRALSDRGRDPGTSPCGLAAYLGLDWHWLWRRCADLGQHGCAGLARPRSRLLSTEAVDAALRFAGMLGRDAAEQ